MQIVRWFMSRPIIAAWALAGLAIVLNLGVGSGKKEDSHAAATDETTATNADHVSTSTEKETPQTAAVAVDDTQQEQEREQAKAAAVGEVPQAPKAPEAPTADEMPVPASVVASSGAAPKTTDEAVEATNEKVTHPTAATPKVSAVATTTPEVSVEAEKAPVPVTDPVAEATKVAPTAPVVPAAPTIPVAPAAAPKVVATPTAPAPATTSVAPVQAVATSAPVAATVQATIPETPVMKATTAVVTSTPVVEKAAVSAAPTAATSNKPALTGFEGKSPTELLQHARMAFKQKAMDKSVAIYQYLIKQQPNVIEYKGELGNVFYHQNKPKEAAALYAEIALPLIQQGKGSQVSNMLGFIGAFYPEKATEISQRLMGK